MTATMMMILLSLDRLFYPTLQRGLSSFCVMHLPPTFVKGQQPALLLQRGIEGGFASKRRWFLQ